MSAIIDEVYDNPASLYLGSTAVSWLTFIWNRDTTVSTVAGEPRNRGSIPCRYQGSCSSSMKSRAFSSSSKAVGLCNWLLIIQNKWSCNRTFPHSFVACIGTNLHLDIRYSSVFIEIWWMLNHCSKWRDEGRLSQLSFLLYYYVTSIQCVLA
jgi:hypothetical protein